jgi:hypothetical protein
LGIKHVNFLVILPESDDVVLRTRMKAGVLIASCPAEKPKRASHVQAAFPFTVKWSIAMPPHSSPTTTV